MLAHPICLLNLLLLSYPLPWLFACFSFFYLVSGLAQGYTDTDKMSFQFLQAPCNKDMQKSVSKGYFQTSIGLDSLTQCVLV